MQYVKPNGVLKQRITPAELAMRLITKNWQPILVKLDEKDREQIKQDLIGVLNSAVELERASTDKFIELTANDVGVVNYYLYLLDKIKYMCTSAFIENSKKKRDLMLVEMSKILGANVVESTLPVAYKIKEIV